MLVTTGRAFTLTLNGTAQAVTVTAANEETGTVVVENSEGTETVLNVLEFSAAFVK